ncbi:MAG: PatB family C-S lyase [Bacteroidales bacterium]|jgi:cystathionine beta-lyase|nr:PatB family C-S lyase [Bacteroidales bacterium]
MYNYNFNEIIDRTGSNCLKKDKLHERFGRSDIIPMWVADMDFKTPDFILNAISERCKHAILGYSFAGDEYYAAITHWLAQRHHLDVQSAMTGFLPGIVPGLALSVGCFSKPSDKVIVQPPVYPPFVFVPQHNNRRLVCNPLMLKNGRFEMNITQFREFCSDARTTMFLLCNPHNPGGRCWTETELAKIAEICAENNVMVVSDEIHSDLVLPGHKHTAFASVSETARQNSITLMAPSKTFNIPGLGSSFYFSHNAELKKRFASFLKKSELAEGNIFAFVATQAAFENGEEWRRQLLVYIDANIRFVDNYLKQHIPQIKAIVPEASFLIWLDCREMRLSQHDLVSFFINKARLALNDGLSFGEGGEGFMRMNVGCSRVILQKALEQLKEAVHQIQLSQFLSTESN